MDAAQVYAKLNTRPDGLTSVEAQERLEQYGPNVLARDQRAGVGKLLWRAVLNPLVLLLAALATISFATGDIRSAVVMLSMIVLSVGLKLIQETRADSAAAKLKAMISVTATVCRDGAVQEIAVARLVPGDVVQLTAGDMVPGDVRIVKAKDLFVIQGSLTGESFPVEKSEVPTNAAGRCDRTNRSEQCRVPRHQRRKRRCQRRGRGDGQGTLIWAAWPSPCRSRNRRRPSIAGSPSSPGSCCASCW